MGLLVLPVGMALACDSYSDYSTDELKEMRALLNNVEADPFDRMEALESLSCSDNPNLRHYALKQGLKSIEEPFLRNEILLIALMEKKRIDVELGKSSELTKDDKNFFTTHAGVYSNLVSYRSLSEGCISFYYKDRCDPGTSMVISGDRVQLNNIHVSGTFLLSREGELIGTLRAQNHSKYTRIPAVIKLF
jgi:hypothetical protein